MRCTYFRALLGHGELISGIFAFQEDGTLSKCEVVNEAMYHGKISLFGEGDDVTHLLLLELIIRDLFDWFRRSDVCLNWGLARLYLLWGLS